MSHNYEAPGPDTNALKAQADAWEKNIYKPFEKEILGRVKSQIKSGGYHGNWDGDHGVSELAESVTRALCALASGDPRKVTEDAIKEAVQKRMEEADYHGHHDKAGGYTV